MRVAFVLIASFVLSPVLAQEEPAKEWTASAELGYVSTGGNTETESINAKAHYEREKRRWRNTASASALNTSDETGTTAEHYVVNVKTGYKASEKNYFFALVNYDKDRFSGYDYRLSEAIGYGRRVIKNPTMTLDLEIGPGARQSKLDNGDTENEITGVAAGLFAWKLSSTSKFTEELTVEAGEDATITKSVTALTSQIVGSLAMKLTFTIKNTSDVPPGIEKTDTETAVTLVYAFN